MQCDSAMGVGSVRMSVVNECEGQVNNFNTGNEKYVTCK